MGVQYYFLGVVSLSSSEEIFISGSLDDDQIAWLIGAGATLLGAAGLIIATPAGAAYFIGLGAVSLGSFGLGWNLTDTWEWDAFNLS